jgi:hypothetical protein
MNASEGRVFMVSMANLKRADPEGDILVLE